MLQHLPNLLTVLRILLVVPLAWAIVSGHGVLALVLAGVAGASDALDGWMARQFGWQSRLGAWLDPAADKLMLAAGFISLSIVGASPWWLTLLVLGRDIVIVSGALTYHYRRERLLVAPSFVSKTNTALQIAWVLLVLVDRLQPLPLDLPLLAWVVALFTVVSGVDYVMRFAAKARRVKAGRRAE